MCSRKFGYRHGKRIVGLRPGIEVHCVTPSAFAPDDRPFSLWMKDNVVCWRPRQVQARCVNFMPQRCAGARLSIRWEKNEDQRAGAQLVPPTTRDGEAAPQRAVAEV